MSGVRRRVRLCRCDLVAPRTKVRLYANFAAPQQLRKAYYGNESKKARLEGGPVCGGCVDRRFVPTAQRGISSPRFSV
ncbi:hypothetical protein BN2476_170111 [Paraburkholderia piptadeniae]|uniref:Uncharacterized protein n=1 Tax=Paraburkholderia piptadeniae TaxID=1701573 RepID=A0A1N7RTG5_9BURK|nr:hypothetical protein BN2476_170111 [Paraburkholderia piptadeniae]